jgi:hypothetical protein
VFGQVLPHSEGLAADAAGVPRPNVLVLLDVVTVIVVVVVVVVLVVGRSWLVPASVRGQVGWAVEPLVALRTSVLDQNDHAAPAKSRKTF